MEVSSEIANKNSVFRQLADAMPHIVWTAKADGVVDYFNKKWYEYTGLEDDNEVKTWLPILHPEDKDICLSTWNEAIKTGNPYHIEYRFRDKDKPGEYRWFLGSAEAAKSPDGTILRWYGTCTDIHDQKEFEASLRESEHHFRFMSDVMPQQVWTANAQGALDYVNQGVVNYFGRTAEAIVGEGWQDFIHPSDIAKIIEIWTHCLKTLEPYQVEFRLKGKNGIYRWHLGRATPYINDEKEVRWFGTNTDIEEHKKNEQQKDEFISMASHELKTPVTSLKGYAQILQHRFKADKDENSYELITRMDNQINKLTKLINDLFDVTKMEHQSVQLDKTMFDFGDIVRDTVDAMRLTTQRHNIQVENTDKINFNGDKLRIEQVITNFLSNAIKYSPDGKEIKVAYHKEKNNIIFSVKDYGIGIERENLNKLFDRFYRVDNSSMKFQGLGLGLYISSQIIKAHKGSFWIESEPGKGSIFYFLLPIEEETIGKISTDNSSYYYDDHLKINYNKSRNSLDVDWTGFQNMQTVQKGCIKMLEFISSTKCNKVLNDNTNVLGNWSEASEWAGQVFLPQCEKEGLKYVAWVYSSSTFSQLAAKKSVDVMIGQITVQFFNNVKEAGSWLENLK